MAGARSLTPARVGTGAAAAARRRWTLVAALVLTAFNLRTAVMSVGPLLVDISAGVGLGSTAAGVLTTLPVACFALVGWYAPGLAHRSGEHRALSVALALMTFGLAGRALSDGTVAFLALSAVALLGGAVGNVLLPSLVKHHFPDRTGPMTALYSTALAVGMTVPAATAVPLAQAAGDEGWRFGLGVWAVLSAVAVLPWLPYRSERVASDGGTGARSAGRMRHSRTAWALAVFFGTQSLQSYVAFGWFALYWREEGGSTAAHAGLLVAVYAGLSIPLSLVVPSLAARMRSQRPLVVGQVLSYGVAYSAMLLAPAGGAWPAVLLLGVGQSAFPLALTLITLRTRTADATASLSAFAQCVGYLLAGTGPLLVGVLHGASGGWTSSFALLFVALAALAVSGWTAAQPRHVEDELAPAV